MLAKQLVLQRFKELGTQADELIANRTFGFKDNEDETHYKVSEPALIKWGTSVLNLLCRIFGEDAIHCREFQTRFTGCGNWESHFRECKAVFDAAKEDYEGGYLFKMRSLIQAEVFGDALSQAAELLRAGYKDAACVVVGVALETTLKELCTRFGVPYGKLDKMNADLCKAGTYNMGLQKQITAWAHLRNDAAHGSSRSYSADDVEDMIRGVTRVIADYL